MSLINDYVFVYLGSALVIVLILIIIVQLVKRRSFNKDLESDDIYTILVKTDKGVIKLDNKSLIGTLDRIKDNLKKSINGATENRQDLKPAIKKAIQNLAEFIKENPSMNSAALCSLELRADLIDNYMRNSVVPDSQDYIKSYEMLLNWENNERLMAMEPRELLKFLINNLNVAIDMLKYNVCDQGHLNIEALYEILMKLNDQINNSALLHTPGSYVTYSPDPANKYDRPPMIPLIVKDIHSIQPFESRETRHRTRAPKGSFSKLNIMEAKNKPNIRNNLAEGFKVEMSDLESSVESFSELQSTDRIKFLNTSGFADYTVPKREIEVGNQSFEGTVEQDIMGYKPPGHIIHQLYDPTDFYTVRVNSCNGKDVSDDNFMRDCMGYDVKLIDAIAGNPNQMLDCIGDCTSESNYARAYNKYNESSAAYDAYGIDFYNDNNFRHGVKMDSQTHVN